MRTANALKGALLLLLIALPCATPAVADSPRLDVAALWLQGEDVTESIDAQAPVRDIRVQVWHDRDDEEVYTRGEALRVHFRTNTDLYAVVYRIDADGYTEILWPQSRYDDGFVYGNHTYSLPADAAGRTLRVSRSKGVEYIQAIASQYPFDLRDLGIDFAFDRDEGVRYDYAVAGDPFLAVNDINYAITGLEEDADFIVTDWTHLYVESQVEHPRYACRQCHVEDTGYHPYVDHCTKVTIYQDWGWHSNWHVSFGWYPLYYEPPFYYWDYVVARPYYFWYYPVYYHWPSWSVYSRPYYLWSWYDSPYYAGDYWVRYKRHNVRSAPLYSIPDSERRLADRSRVPVSVRRTDDPTSRDRTVRRDQLVRNDIPTRERGEMPRVTADRRGRGTRVDTNRGVRSGIRTDVRPSERRLSSLRPVEGVRSGGSEGGRRASELRRGSDSNRAVEGRRWTRPVIRNVDPRRDSSRSSSGDDGRRRTVEPRRQSREESQRQPQKIERNRTEPRRVTPERKQTPDRSKSRDVQRQKRDDRSKQGGSTLRSSQPAQPKPRSSARTVTPKKQSSGRSQSGSTNRSSVKQTPRSSSSRSSATKSRSSSGSSKSRGGSSSGKSRGGGRGGRG